MKRTAILILFGLAQTGLIEAADPAPGSDAQLLPIIKEIQAQQAVLESNQAKIEGKIATVTEAVRMARIYSSRAGR